MDMNSIRSEEVAPANATAAAPDTAMAEAGVAEHAATEANSGDPLAQAPTANDVVNKASGVATASPDLDCVQVPPADDEPPDPPSATQPPCTATKQDEPQSQQPTSQSQAHTGDESQDRDVSPAGRSTGRTGSSSRGGSKRSSKGAASAEEERETSPHGQAAALTTRTTRSRSAAAAVGTASAVKPPVDANTGEGYTDEQRHGSGSSAARDADGDEQGPSGRTSATQLEKQPSLRGSARGRKQNASADNGEGDAEAPATASAAARSNRPKTRSARRIHRGSEEEAAVTTMDAADDPPALTTRRSSRKGSAAVTGMGPGPALARAVSPDRGGQGGSTREVEAGAAEGPSAAAPSNTTTKGAEGDQAHEKEDIQGDLDGKSGRIRTSTAAATKPQPARPKSRYGGDRSGTRGPQRWSSVTEAKGKPPGDEEAKAESGVAVSVETQRQVHPPAETTLPPAPPLPPPPPAAVSEFKVDDTTMEDAQGSALSPLGSQRPKRQRLEVLPNITGPGPAAPVAAVTTLANTSGGGTAAAAAGDADGDDGPGAAGRPRATKRQAVKPSAASAASLDPAGTSVQGTKTPAAAGQAAASAATPGPAAATAAAGHGSGGGGGGGSFEGRISDRIAAALTKLEQARLQEAEAVSELNSCAQALYDHPFNFQSYKLSKLAIMVMRASKTAAKAVSGGVLTGDGVVASAAGGIQPLAQVAADMKGIVAVIKRLNESKVMHTQEPLRDTMQSLGISSPVPGPLPAPVPAAPAPAASTLAQAVSAPASLVPAVLGAAAPAPPAPSAAADAGATDAVAAATAPQAAAPPHHVVSAFTLTGEPVRDKAIAILAHALGNVTPVHPVQAALAIEAQLASQLGNPGSGSESYLARLRWLCDLLASDGAHFVPEVGQLVLEGKLTAEDLVGYEGRGAGTGGTAPPPQSR